MFSDPDVARALLCALVWLRLSVWVSDIILHGGFGVNQHLYILNATQREFLKPAELFCHFMLLFISFVCRSFFCEQDQLAQTQSCSNIYYESDQMYGW